MKFLGFLMLVMSASAFASSVNCREGDQSVTVTGGQNMEIGASVDVVLTRVANFGGRLTTITTPLTGKIIPDTRPLIQPDPATLIQLNGENESGETNYGLLIARPNLQAAQSIQIQETSGEGMTVTCE